MSAADALNMIQESKAKFIDFRFTDTKGKEQHVSVPASAVEEETFEEEKKLWKILFEETHLMLTPGKDAKNKKPGTFRACFAATPFESLKVAIKRISEGLDLYKNMS